MNNHLESIYNFIKKIERLKEIKRITNAARDGRKENSAEHSWSVAMLCWMFSTELEREFSTQLDTPKMIKMALMHDLIECIVGDVSAWDKNARQKIRPKEQLAANQLFNDLPENTGKELQTLWNEFGESQTLEAKIVSALDRLSGSFSRLITEQGWKVVNKTTADLDNLVQPLISFSKTLGALHQQIKKEAIAENLISE